MLNMKIVFFSLLCLILIGITSYSYAQMTAATEITNLPEILLQLEQRDSNGNLLAYIESEHITGIAPLELNRFLDNLNNTSKEFFIKDDIKYEKQQWEKATETFNKRHAWSAFQLLDIYQNEFVSLLVVRHDSFQSEPGDSIRVFWTVIRPVS